MDYKAIEQLMKAMDETNLTHLEIEEEGIKIKMKKEKEVVAVAAAEPKVQPVTEAAAPKTAEKTEEPSSKTEEKEGTLVCSPIVGTFYSAPAPGAKPFVSLGDKVKKGDVLCIIEAMKLMNEIESDVDGEIVEIFVQNEEMVEYNQPLFRIKGGC
ncbi:MAG: acetyl-CoA carboxylase biotin carboxyl carrier protein [Epulopiscium sp.]|jgi:acetyl-CoA carboxylase biotin carboxyl carrier protein|uniref:acetyl-CoA carboxylase biotin carboxyl carrier protein n=1 Tax=Defluviitalea raffinosedens TaxID=1450156 RepID=UPI001764DB0E|nr:acetyl-CoA carboxylase biotin carboxyl carrier protein [Defluviitalea raffinosedens]MBM7685049.1 acetyl-CoA carboxylase biotin carboxyl carrier protein [Defluviitalea raffinosedens]MBZ4666880.1 acetyl-CoA carboxylase biotin carboxyl carrier protein subunit [Defluviitaleaceae bacterium]MDK2786943.1 acetyl-CoA carboxylase biotin carboxyl carrier protein [Candidatus Epulonipiscium sp.]HHW67487.1 acetyl-CoA carboxylase biotin carboxyl carrier protein [Candidatus Epulonipiscium sp.]